MRTKSNQAAGRHIIAAPEGRKRTVTSMREMSKPPGLRAFWRQAKLADTSHAHFIHSSTLEHAVGRAVAS